MPKLAWKKIKFGQLLIVNWDDIISTEAWVSEEEANQLTPLDCVSIGWVLSVDAEVLRLSSTISGQSEANVIVIPKGVITRIRELEYDRE